MSGIYWEKRWISIFVCGETRLAVNVAKKNIRHLSSFFSAWPMAGWMVTILCGQPQSIFWGKRWLVVKVKSKDAILCKYLATRELPSFQFFFFMFEIYGLLPSFHGFRPKKVLFLPFFSVRVWESSVRVNGIYDCCWLFGLVGGGSRSRRIRKRVAGKETVRIGRA